MSTRDFRTGPAAGEYSVEDDNQLQPEDSLIDKGDQQRSDEAEREAEFPERSEVGRVRSGRLIAPDRGFGEDTEAELVADDIGISGGSASAEEAAVHIIDDEDK